ncbi:MAG: hypothetical protein JETT_3798 [Candidatus Jettenia ecosi]|uniref:Uncharacterized protein n=1 Tax=Candidatus Jettenia ecosi TaxID=2494326 RepID=A0A533Q5W6_9BACT|nr:MAG: hypothetical protein JETT_3798 [Candidatus Jettenia ecosi]
MAHYSWLDAYGGGGSLPTPIGIEIPIHQDIFNRAEINSCLLVIAYSIFDFKTPYYGLYNIPIAIVP